MKRALIIGCGYTGSVLARRLLRRGVAVCGTSLSGPGAPQPLPDGAAWTSLALDLIHPPASLSLPQAEGAVVYYMVSTLHRRHDPLARPHLDPPRAVLAALERHRPAGLVYLSSTSVYGDQQGGWVDEQTPVAPASPWARMRVEIEALLRERCRQRRLPLCVARLPEIYGPGRGPLARLRKGYRLRYPDRYSNRIHVEDLAMVLDRLGRALAAGAPAPELLLISDGHPARSDEVYRHAAALLGVDPPPLSDEDVGDPNRRGLMQESKRCDNTLLRRFLDAPLAYPDYRVGLPASD